MDRNGDFVSIRYQAARAKPDPTVYSHHSGQMCSASSRIFVQSGIYDAFVSGMTQAAQSAKGGSSFDPTTTSGPVVSQLQFDVGVEIIVWSCSAS